MKNYFESHETECKCGCGINNFSKLTRSMLNHARARAKISFVLLSACRCEKHNKKEGGKDGSAHISTEKIECEAVDIQYSNSRERFLIINALIKAGFTRIGVAKDFIHADNSSTKVQNVMWLY